jgi:xanthine dehydrogenase YagT iron-sulfur-binding subunit
MVKSRSTDDAPLARSDAALSRRGLLGVTAASAAMPLVGGAGGAQAVAPPQASDPRAAVRVLLTVNGQTQNHEIDARMSLLDLLRERLGLTGSKKGCDHGQCGACTVLVGGRRILSCLSPAVGVREPVTTIEGLATPDGQLHPMQQAFIDQDAFQCGYCTPGQILSAIACVEEGHARSDDEIREYMSGNLCRCAAYPHIVKAINQAKAKMIPAADARAPQPFHVEA